MKKEKTVRTYQRRTKSGKIVTVRQHTSKYDAAERAKDSSKRKGAGEELEKVKTKKALQKADLFDGYDFSEEDFNEWYEGTGSASDKKVAKALRKTLGRKAYDELNDAAADSYKKGGASSFFKKNVKSSSPKNANEKAAEAKTSKSKTKHWSENVGHGNEGWTPEQQAIINYEGKHAGYPEFDKSHFGRASHKIDWMTKDSYESLEPKDWKSLYAAMLKDQKSSESKKSNGKTKTSKESTKSSAKTEEANDYTIVKGPGMMGGDFAVKDGKAYTRDVTKKNPKWKPMKEWTSTAQKVLEYYEELQDTSMPKLKRKTSTKTSSANAKVSKPKEEYKAYKKLMDEKQKTGKRLSITETTKLKKLAKDAGVGRFIE